MLWFVVLLLFFLNPPSVPAVIFFSTADPNHNTTPPTGALANSGWESEGLWGSFLGTPIAPQHFITAEHVGGAVGDLFAFQGVEYRTSALFDDPDSDLRIWRINGRFPLWAEVYTTNDEVGKDVMVFGRGTQKGDEVTVNRPNGPALRGWRWGVADGRQRWGQNQVGSIVTNGVGQIGGGNGVGEQLKMPFNAGAGAEEATLSEGDSGGGVFIKDDSAWKLAGINFAVDGPYNTTNTGPGFQAAIFDEGGLYIGGEGQWTLARDLAIDLPGAFYATRLSSRWSWINGILTQPSANEPPVLQSAAELNATFTDELNASVDGENRVIRAARPAGLRFYRIRASTPVRISGFRVEENLLILDYE